MNKRMDKGGPFSFSFLYWLEEQKNTLFLETSRSDRKNFRSHLFTDPIKIVSASSLTEIESTLAEVQKAVEFGLFAAGFVSYEAGYAFEKILGEPKFPEVPMIWFGIYKTPIVYNAQNRRFESGARRYRRIVEEQRGSTEAPQTDVSIDIVPSITEDDYTRDIQKIAEYIIEGHTYQTNYTFKLKISSEGSAAWLYHHLRSTQPVCYSAFVNAGDTTILSLSPELFFRMEGSKITLRPMKGTVARGRNLEEDEFRRNWLKSSEKDRSENLMIVDLLRNDVGRIARTGSVQVRNLFQIEQYQSVFQATSTIQATLRKGVGVQEIIQALFPCGSVTGAPKIRTMQIIHELEKEPRGIYTGAIGFFAPERRAIFNVAIRTLVRIRPTGEWEMGVGSGIVHDSAPHAEYQECLLKARFLNDQSEDFQLFETIRFDIGTGWFLLRRHLARLRESARYFGFSFSRVNLIQYVNRIEREVRRLGDSASIYRVKLILRRDGTFDSEARPLDEPTDSARVGMSNHRTNSHDRYLFHKTTHRALYDRELTDAEQRGWFDVIFLNERDEVTEGARTNVVIRKGRDYFTPPLECGLLPGVFRSYLISQSEWHVREQVLTLKDLQEADELFVCNALRGMVRVSLAPVITAPSA